MENKPKVVVVTGGSGLLGKAMIMDLQQKGHTVINFDVNVENDLSKGTFQCDVTNDTSVRESLASVAKQLGSIHGFVNNAYPRTKDWGVPFEEDDLISWRKNVDLQLNSYVSCCQAVLKIMKTQQVGSVVNITSIYGVVGNDFTIYEGTNIKPPAAYAAIKGGIVNLSRYLASFYGRYNVRVNCVSPGGIFDNQDKTFVQNYEHKVPMKRMGTPADIAPAVSFLLSDEAGYITGQNLIVDGGWTAI